MAGIGRVSIVTGGGKGIGRAVCQRLAADGAGVVVADLDLQAAADVANTLARTGSKAIAVGVNVTSAAQTQAMVERTLREFGQVDALVNVAGIYPKKGFMGISEAEWDFVVNVNLKGAFLCGQAVSRPMMARGIGAVVNVSSDAFPAGGWMFVHYAAAKGGVVGLTRAMARELGPYGITVNCVAPGLTVTDTTTGLHSPATFDSIRAARSLARDEHPADVAGVVSFLLSSDSRFMTGQTLLVEGGGLFL